LTYQENGKTQAKQYKGSDMAHPVNLTVVSGSTLPVSRIQQREEALELFQKGAIDQQDFLEHMEWPNRDQIITRMQAGPMAQVMEKLTQVGVPPPLLEYLKGVAEADPKKLQQALQTGEYPAFQEIIQEMITENMPKQPEQQQEPPEMLELRAKVQVLEAEAALKAASAQTEAVKQEVMLAGVRFDEDQMKIKRAEAVHNMESDIKKNYREDTKAASDMVSTLINKPGYNEKGNASNNVNVEPSV
jgi:hypothetical protein